MDSEQFAEFLKDPNDVSENKIGFYHSMILEKFQVSQQRRALKGDN